jgi:hypothetical protein
MHAPALSVLVWNGQIAEPKPRPLEAAGAFVLDEVALGQRRDRVEHAPQRVRTRPVDCGDASVVRQ